jgi:LPS sulfotransferase NodH
MPDRKLFVPEVHNNEHLLRIGEFFGHIAHQPADIPADVKFIFLCFTNRSGSNYLAELLASSQRLPLAAENLNFNTVIDHAKQQSLRSFQDYFSFLVRLTASDGVVNLKVAPSNLEVLGRSGVLDQIIDRSRFIVIERADKLAQAISHLIAFQTGKFKSTIQSTGIATAPQFDRETLNRIINRIAMEYHDFSLFFGRNGIASAHVIYEQMVQDPERALAFVCPLIGYPGLRIKPELVRLGRQSSSLNKEWREMYLSDTVFGA